MFARCELTGTWKKIVSKLIYECFREVSYGLQMSKLVICPRRVKNYDTETKGLHYLRVNIDRVKAFSCQSDHRSASRSHGPFIIRYFDVFGSVSVLDNISFFQVPWGLLTMRWYIVNCRFPNPGQRATTAAMPCSSVSRGEYTLTLGQV